MGNLSLTVPAPATMAALQAYAHLIFDAKIVAPLPAKKRVRKGEAAPDNTITTDSPVTHTHHILPKSLFPQFARKKWNLVRLVLPEHFDAHVLLTKAMDEQIAVHRALYIMYQRYPITDPGFDWAQAAESERLTNAAASVLQAERRRQDWQNPEYRAKISAAISRRNTADWQDDAYRATQAAAIRIGRREKFYANPEAVARATAAQSQKTSAENHWAFKPVNIYRHKTGELIAERVCLTDYCERYRLNQPHMHQSLWADRTLPSGRGNRAHSKGYFARALDDDGNVIGVVCPAVSAKDHHHAKRADIYRASDNICIARNVIISQFCIENDIGMTFSQSALSRTAKSDRTMPSSRENPLWHKGHYAQYVDGRFNG